MKSIGNGWKRAQEARIRAAKVQAAIEELERDSARFWANYRQPSTTPFQPIDAPWSQNVYPDHCAFSDEPTVSSPEHREAQKALNKRFAGLIERIKNAVL